MKRIAFPLVVTAIIVAGVAFSSASKAARSGVSEDALLRSGHTVDHSCGSVTTDDTAGGGEPMQLASAIRCAENSNGTCANPGNQCGTWGSKKKKNENFGVCTTVISQQKRVSCACVK
ncbi:MAG TPA: hypothetical protein VFO62_04080 [Candidatus Binatia bacterium]|nr:hypothetical protein [Candidatus Binatia bacterium]